MSEIQWEEPAQLKEVLIMNDKLFVKKKYVNDKLKSIQLVFGKGAKNINKNMSKL